MLGYIKTEILIVLGTSSSESVLPNLMEKLEKLDCDKSVVRLVIPTGYSFNLDGTAIYLSLVSNIILAKYTLSALGVVPIAGIVIILGIYKIYVRRTSNHKYDRNHHR